MNAPVSGTSHSKVTNEAESTEKADINEEDYISITNNSKILIEPEKLHPSEATNTNPNDQEGYEQGEDGEEYYYYVEDDGEYNLEEGENGRAVRMSWWKMEKTWKKRMVVHFCKS